MINVGLVLYTKTEKPGTLKAKWCHFDDGTGIGIATGGPVAGFEGLYNIRYFDGQGNLKAERELEIRKKNNCYKLRWLLHGKVTSKGIGLVTIKGLVAGYRNVKKVQRKKWMSFIQK
ncbi:MAG: hypothetical protein GY874_24395 [Desulfobacteraceae bacterium]|nr:hypothetical protein [Desulfobacteraceae bacterium]